MTLYRGKDMSKVITEEEIRQWILEKKVIQDGDVSCAEGIKYDFRLGSKFLKAYFGREVDYNVDLKTAEDRRKAVVEPGEVVFVLSQERLSLPDNVYVQLSPKRSLSQDGIELMGGLIVDPGYEGYLVFGLRNVAGTPFPLAPGIKIAGANFFELSQEEISEKPAKPTPIEEFPVKLLDLIEKYRPVNPQNLADEFRKLQKAFEDSQGKLVEDVSELKNKVGSISKDLIIEATKREQENKLLADKFSNVEVKLETITRDNIRHDENLRSVNSKLDSIDEMTQKINENIISNKANKDVKKNIWTAVITFVITLLATVLAAVILGFINLPVK